MRRPLTVCTALLVLVVAASLAGGGLAQSQPPDGPGLVAQHGNATNYLAIAPEAVERSDRARVGMDVGLVIDSEGRAFQADQTIATFRERFGAGTTDAERTAAVVATIATLENRTETLQARTDAAVAAHADGSIAAETLVRERAAVAVEAARLQAVGREIVAVERDRLDYDLPDDQALALSNLSGRLATLEGPISDRTARLAAGAGGSQSIYVESSASGYVFASVEGDTYVREAYLGEEYDPAGTDEFTQGPDDRIEQMLARATELYPRTSSEGVSGFGRTGIYRYNAEFAGGSVSVFIDGATTNAFRERQQVAAGALPPSEVTTTVNGTTELRVNRTFPTGPMEITVQDADSGTPVAGSVTVNGHSVGTTDAEGRVWAVEPRGEATIEARTTDAVLEMTVGGA